MNRDNDSPKNLNELLDKVEETVEQNDEQISLGAILEIVGRRSFGPLLLVIGIMPVVPIPGIPTITGIIVLLISVQLLFRKKYFWLPDWLLNRSIESEKLGKSIDWLRRPVRFIDNLIKPRLSILSTGYAIYFIGAACILIGITLPLLETIPFSAIVGGIALSIFGLSLITKDGLLSLIAFTFTLVTATLIAMNFI